MSKRSTGFFMGVALCVFLASHGQTEKPVNIGYKQVGRPEIKDLTIGDHVPDFYFNEVMNYSSPTAKLSDFKAKLTILDFWSTSCSSCIALFPHMQALKEKFGDQIQIVLVNGKTLAWQDNQQKIKKLLQRQKDQTGSEIALPIVLNSSELDGAFLWQTIPHEVWINANREIIAITGANEVNEENIKAILGGQNIKMHLKKDALFDIGKTPLQEWLYGASDASHRPVYTSTIWKGYIDGLNGNGIRRAGDNFSMITGWYIVNMPLFDLILSAFVDTIRGAPNNQILVETNDSAKYSRIYPTDAALYDNVYSYDLTVPPTLPKNILKYVQQDISRAFNISLRTEKRTLNCMTIQMTGMIKPCKINENRDWITEDAYLHKYIHNYPLNEIIEALNEHMPIPLIDDTGSSENIDIDLPQNLNDPEAVKICLEKAGLKVTKEKRQFDVVVISDSK